jgi:hypothetical protein
VANFSTSFASVADTGGKFATGVNDTGSKQWEQLSPLTFPFATGAQMV